MRPFSARSKVTGRPISLVFLGWDGRRAAMHVHGRPKAHYLADWRNGACEGVNACKGSFLELTSYALKRLKSMAMREPVSVRGRVVPDGGGDMRGYDEWKLATPPEYADMEGEEVHDPPCPDEAGCTVCDAVSVEEFVGKAKAMLDRFQEHRTDGRYKDPEKFQAKMAPHDWMNALDIFVEREVDARRGSP